MDAKSYSKQIRAEADKLLEQTGLQQLLEQFGKAEIGGSFDYGLMVDRDLDFGVAVSEMTPKIRADIAALFAAQPWAYSVNITDRVNFEPLSNLQAPRGLYLGLTIPFPKERWNVDVWFTIGITLPEDELATMIKGASDEQKMSMLEIKYALMNSGRKEKGITSAEVYKAVLSRDVRTLDDFLKLQ